MGGVNSWILLICIIFMCQRKFTSLLVHHLPKHKGQMPRVNPGRFGPIPVQAGRFGPGRFGPISGVSRFGPVGAGRFGPIS